MSQESSSGNYAETHLGQTTIDLAEQFNVALPPTRQLDHEGFTYPDFRQAYDVYSLQQQKQLADSLAQIRRQTAMVFDSPGDPTPLDDLIKKWEKRPIDPPDELSEFRGDKVIRSIVQASDRQLLHFLGWNKASLLPSSVALALRIEDLSQSFVVDIEDMIEAGQVPPQALGALVLGQVDRNFYAVDSFTSCRLFCLGMTSEDTTQIAEHLIFDRDQQCNDVCSHEMLHGVEFAIGRFFDQELATPESGTNLWVSEAFIEHTVQTAAMTVEWDEPGAIENEHAALYLEERKLLGAILRVGDFPMRCFADAFMGAPERQLAELVGEGSNFKDSLLDGQPNILAVVSREYNQAISRGQKNAILKGWQKRLARA